MHRKDRRRVKWDEAIRFLPIIVPNGLESTSTVCRLLARVEKQGPELAGNSALGLVPN